MPDTTDPGSVPPEADNPPGSGAFQALTPFLEFQHHERIRPYL